MRVFSLLAMLVLLVGVNVVPAQTVDSNELSTVIFTNGRELEARLNPPRPGYEVVRMPDGGLGSRPAGSSAAPEALVGSVSYTLPSGTSGSWALNLIGSFTLPSEKAAQITPSLVAEVRVLAYAQGKPLEALTQLESIYAQNPNSDEVREFAFDLAASIYEQAQRSTRRAEFDNAFRSWDALVAFFERTGVTLVNPAPDPGEPLSLETEFWRDYAQALHARVQSLIDEAVLTTPVDEDKLRRANQYVTSLLALTQNRDFEALLKQVDIHEHMGNTSRAIEILEDTERRLSSLTGVSPRDREMIQLRIQNLREGQGGTAAPTPRVAQPAPTEVPALPSFFGGNGDRAQSPPPAQARPSGGPSLTGDLMTDIRMAISNRDFGRVIDLLQFWAKQNMALVSLVGGILGALIFLWLIPYKMAMKRARAGSILASVWAPKIKVWGPLGCLGWMFASIRGGGGGGADGKDKKKKKKKRGKKGYEHPCPACGEDLGRVDLYREMQFQMCPHCSQPITPVFNINNFIDHLVARIDSARGGKMIDEEALKDSGQRDTMLKLVRAVITHAVRSRASDIHIEATGDGLDVRARIDGLMTPLNVHITKLIERAFISATKVLADLDITERRAPQDGRFDMKIDAVPIDFRINTSPTGLGERITMRVLDIRSVQVPMDNLGFSEEGLKEFRRTITAPHGMMLVTGPTGSGKSTTLYVALNEISDGTRNIVTLEDPIEFIFRGLNQHQVNPGANFTFANGLRSMIRSDPDVIMVGEIRDNETAGIAVDAATTGHLVMSTLHTIDAPGAYQRLMELGVAARRFAPSLLMVLAQRLARISCSHCLAPYIPDSQVIVALGIQEKVAEVEMKRGQGCDVCQNLGYKGRVGIFEAMMVNDEIRGVMEEEVTTVALREKARQNGMKTLREEGIRRVLEGLTTPEEVHRVIS